MKTSNAEQQLNRLLTRNYDAEKGYQEVAEKVEHPEMRSFMMNNAKQRYDFGHELKDIMGDMSIKPDKGTSISGDVHRAWLNVKDLISKQSDEAILDEAERGEEYAIEDYENAISNAELSPNNKRKLSDHLNSIKKSKEQISRLRATL